MNKIAELKGKIAYENNKRKQILDAYKQGTLSEEACKEILRDINKKIADYTAQIKKLEEENIIRSQLMPDLETYEKEQNELIKSYKAFLLSTFRNKAQADLSTEEKPDLEKQFAEENSEYSHRDKTFIFNFAVDKMQEYAAKGYSTPMPKYLIEKLRKRIKPFILEESYQNAVNAGFIISETEAINSFLLSQRYDLEDLTDNHYRKERPNRKLEQARQEEKKPIIARLSKQINIFLKNHKLIPEICNILSQNVSNEKEQVKKYLEKCGIMFTNEDYLQELTTSCRKLIDAKTQVDITENEIKQEAEIEMLRKTRTRNTLSGLALYTTSAMCITYGMTNGGEISVPVAEIGGVATGIATIGSIVSKTKKLRR